MAKKTVRKKTAPKKTNRKISKLKSAIILHPFLLALYPPLFIFGHNVKEAIVGNAAFPLVLSLLGSAALFFLLKFLIKDALKAGIISSAAIIAFFSYGHVYGLASGGLPFDSYSLNHLVMLAVYGVFFYFLTDWLVKTDKLKEINMILNFMSAVLVVMALVQSTYGVASYHSAIYSKLDKKISVKAAEARKTVKDKKLPDIYFIILDGHARRDVMKEMYGYDDAPFLDFLKNEGFYTAEKANSNYCQTFLSLGATMNMNYHQSKEGEGKDGEASRVYLGEMIRRNMTVDTLREHGYLTVSYFSGFVGTEMKRIYDIYLPGEDVFAGEMSEFDSVFFSTTMLSGFTGVLNIALKKKAGPHTAYARRTQYVLENIHDSASLSSPKFVLAHVLAPHPPFVFDENGPTDKYVGTAGVAFHDGSHNAFPKDEYKKAYVAQAKYVHKKVKEMVKKLKAATKGEAIIILQADHGPGSEWDVNSMEKTNLKERFGIFSSYYLPQGGEKLLYPEITPINNFRLIFKHYLGLDYELLEDKSYYSTWERPFKFFAVEF